MPRRISPPCPWTPSPTSSRRWETILFDLSDIIPKNNQKGFTYIEIQSSPISKQSIKNQPGVCIALSNKQGTGERFCVCLLYYYESLESLRGKNDCFSIVLLFVGANSSGTNLQQQVSFPNTLYKQRIQMKYLDILVFFNQTNTSLPFDALTNFVFSSVKLMRLSYQTKF